MVQKLNRVPLRRLASFSRFCGLGAKVLKGRERQAGIFFCTCSVGLKSLCSLICWRRVISFNSARIQVHQQVQKGWLMISSLYFKHVFRGISNTLPMEEAAQATRPRPLLPALQTVKSGKPQIYGSRWVVKVRHIISKCVTTEKCDTE